MDDEPRTTKEKKFSYRKMLVRYSLAKKYCKGVVLDVGCGYAYQSEMFDNYFGIDNFPPAIQYTNKTYPKKFILMNAPPLYFADEMFDSVICCEMIEHLREDQGFCLAVEMYRVLKKGGILFLSTPNADNKLPETNHKKEYSQKELKKLLENVGFTVFHIQGISISFNKHCPSWLKQMPRLRAAIGKIMDLTIRSLFVKHNSPKSEHQVMVARK